MRLFLCMLLVLISVDCLALDEKQKNIQDAMYNLGFVFVCTEDRADENYIADVFNNFIFRVMSANGGYNAKNKSTVLSQTAAQRGMSDARVYSDRCNEQIDAFINRMRELRMNAQYLSFMSSLRNE